MNVNLTVSIKRGHIYRVNFGNDPLSAIHGIRPAIVLQNDVANQHASTVIVAAITETAKKDRQPTHVITKMYPDPAKDCMILLEYIVTVDKQAIGKHLGYVCDASLWPVNQALAYSIDIPAHKQKMSEEEKAARREIRAAKRKKKQRAKIRSVDAL